MTSKFSIDDVVERQRATPAGVATGCLIWVILIWLVFGGGFVLVNLALSRAAGLSS